MDYSHLNKRRHLLKFLAASPLLTFRIPDSTDDIEDSEVQNIIQRASDAINVFDFQKAAEKKLSAAHYGYLRSGVLDDLTLKENRKAYSRVKLKIRQLTGIEEVNTAIKLFEEEFTSPLFLCPCGSQKAFHPEGEAATARAAKSEDHLQLLSTMSNISVEEVARIKAGKLWYQLYPVEKWEDTMLMIKRAENSGCKVLVITIDGYHQDKRETFIRARKLDKLSCKPCHGSGNQWRVNWKKRKPMISHLSDPFKFPVLDWNYINRVRDSTSMKVVLKGITEVEDAKVALENGVEGIIVSNHGGRKVESGKSSLDSLQEIAPVIGSKIPIMLDGGVRRGKDIFKALALGADAVGIGEPYIWGLASFGEEGVATVLKLLKAEFRLAMIQTGVKNIAEIGPSQIA